MNLNPRSIVLVAVDAFGRRVTGKTLLQKRLYFLEELLRPATGDLGLDYGPHYYGPYSSTIASEIGTLVIQGLLRENSTGFGASNAAGFEVRRYCYELSEEGQTGVAWLRKNYPEDAALIDATAKRITQAEGTTEDYLTLSVAAKAHCILKRTKQPLTEQAIALEARRFGWTVTEEQIRRGRGFLERLGLVSRSASEVNPQSAIPIPQ